MRALLILWYNINTMEKPYVVLRDDFDNCSASDLPFKEYDNRNVPFQFFPKIYEDKRGGFCESIVSGERDWMLPELHWMKDLISNVKQVNRSYSKPGIMRGFHAQKAPFCQSKLVECIGDTPIWDIIIDARPDSKSFQQYTLFKLSGKDMSKVWVPQGFLHGFIVSKYNVVSCKETKKYDLVPTVDDGQFQYFVDNSYSPESEICIAPHQILNAIIDTYYEEFKANNEDNADLYALLKTCQDGLEFSDKDSSGKDYFEFLKEIQEDYEKYNKLWYK